ncbi:pilus assembly FimT family protein [Massilia glaciei]|uniref:Type II secretion system protein n=1 Tax=Massilia glaciei TaxID=1524097 RepID=A0A2U2HJQ1_9BURK|nr:type II secretion system protein [Massilia glaciei]PWF47729.1 type II secretion system protein [Massilia glaciei]
MRQTRPHAAIRTAAKRRARAFTLVEMVLVIVIVGILSAVAAARIMDRGVTDSAVFAEQGRAMLRYAQKVAVAQNRDVHVRLDGASISLCYQPGAGCPAGARVRAPGGANSDSAATKAACGDSTWHCEAPPTNITLTTLPGITAFYFDPIGKPFASTDVSPTTVSSFTTLTVRVSAGGSNRDTTVERETGYVH